MLLPDALEQRLFARGQAGHIANGGEYPIFAAAHVTDGIAVVLVAENDILHDTLRPYCFHTLHLNRSSI